MKDNTSTSNDTIKAEPLKPKPTVKQLCFEYLLMFIGSAVFGAAIYFFMFPNNFTMGGVSGLSIVLGDVLKKHVAWLTPGTFVLIINMSLLLIGFMILGRDFGVRTAYCSTIISVMTYVLEWLCPLSKPLTTEPLLELGLAVFLPAIGSAMLFYLDASSGGTDVVAMIIKKFFRINISPALFISDALIVIGGAIVFKDATLFICNIVGFFAKVFLVNNVLESINTSKYCTVVTTPACQDEICHFITHVLHKTATFSDSYTGAYGKDKKVVFLVALTRGQALKLRNYAKTLPDGTFIIITNTNEIIGRGFREPI